MMNFFEIARFWLSCVLGNLLQKTRIFFPSRPMESEHLRNLLTCSSLDGFPQKSFTSQKERTNLKYWWVHNSLLQQKKTKMDTTANSQFQKRAKFFINCWNFNMRFLDDCYHRRAVRKTLYLIQEGLIRIEPLQLESYSCLGSESPHSS